MQKNEDRRKTSVYLHFQRNSKGPESAVFVPESAVFPTYDLEVSKIFRNFAMHLRSIDNDVFASKMTGQDAESALAALPTAQNNMNHETFNRKIRITMEINNSTSNRRGSPPVSARTTTNNLHAHIHQNSRADTGVCPHTCGA